MLIWQHCVCPCFEGLCECELKYVGILWILKTNQYF